MMETHMEKVDIYKPRRQASGESNPVDLLISDILPLKFWENGFLLFKPPHLWYVVWQPQQTNTIYIHQGSPGNQTNRRDGEMDG